MTDKELFGNSEQLDDNISRQAALEAMDTWDKFGCDPDGKLVRYDDDNHYVPYVHYDDMVHAIKALPSAQTGRQKGKWLPDNNNYYEERFICSVCGKSYNVDTCMGKPMWNFCPCGADMMEDGDGNG